MVEGHDIVHFSFLDMLPDLLRNRKFNGADNLCINPDENYHFEPFKPRNSEDFSETISKLWATKTQDSLWKISTKTRSNLFPPPNFYADKTGKHINQWYPQEPWMFMTTLLRRKTCESADSWQQLDFLPSLDVIGTPNNDKEGPVSNDSQSKLQLNHKNSEGTLKALVHSVEYKKERLPTHLTLPPTNPP
jgi:hypothetical protein